MIAFGFPYMRNKPTSTKIYYVKMYPKFYLTGNGVHTMMNNFPL